MTHGALKEKKATIWKRDGLDWYVEEARAVDGLLAVEKFMGIIHDPACGIGTIPEACIRQNYRATGTDLVRRAPFEDGRWWQGCYDFLTAPMGMFENIICNPPFFKGAGTEAFIRRALSLTSGKVAIFTSIKFLAGGKRANGLFKDHTPTRIWVVTPRVSCPPGEYLKAGEKAGGGTDDWCWIVWDKSSPAPAMPALGWIRK